MFCLGTYENAIHSPTGQPYVEVLLNATKSPAATIVLTSVLLILTAASYINGLATVSRQLWSFSRDGAMPFSKWLSRVHPGLAIPMNAIVVSIVISVCLTLISVGSSVAYGVFTSLLVSGLLTSYLICIACIFYRRNWGDPLPAAQFTLGKAGNPINVIALSFLTVAWTFQFFPFAPKPDASDMNWSLVIYVACAGFFSLYYLLRARHQYDGPVTLVKTITDYSDEKEAVY